MLRIWSLERALGAHSDTSLRLDPPLQAPTFYSFAVTSSPRRSIRSLRKFWPSTPLTFCLLCPLPLREFLPFRDAMVSPPASGHVGEPPVPRLLPTTHETVLDTVLLIPCRNASAASSDGPRRHVRFVSLHSPLCSVPHRAYRNLRLYPRSCSTVGRGGAGLQ